jgi:SAM-dependent methyltransferase
MLDPEWTDSFDCILEKGALDAIYLSGDGHVEQAVAELRRVLRPGGTLVSVSGVLPDELRRELFQTWNWMRDGTNDLKAGCFILQNV